MVDSMSSGVILAHLGGTETETSVLNTALALARPIDGHIDALFVRPDPSKSTHAFEEGFYAGSYAPLVKAIEQQWTDLSKNIFERFEKWRATKQLHARYEPNGGNPSVEWREIIGDEREVIKHAGQLADVIVMAHRTGQAQSQGEPLFETALLGTGRPIVLAPPHAHGDLALEKILVAWNSSPEAARAVGAALPLLSKATEVFVFSAREGKLSGRSAEELVEYLSWHGVRASVFSSRNDTNSVPEAVLAAAKRSRADLLVMGAYTHSRLRELAFGGVTRHVLSHAALSVFMSH